MKKKTVKTSLLVRIIHRYLGFFLAGIMSVYALSGILLIFRDTDFLKKEISIEKKLKPNLKTKDLGSKLKMKLRGIKTEGEITFFKGGTYNQTTGVAKYTKKELPIVLKKMEHLHKAKTDSPLYYLNIFFGVALLFFSISSFWMYAIKTTIFKKGVYFAIAGIVLTLVMLFY